MSNFVLIHLEAGRFLKAWTKNILFEKEALEQLNRCSKLPFIFKWLAVMPDVHSGKGSTIGSVIATKDAVIPAAVGLDIGCGMRAARLNLHKADIDPVLQNIFDAISKAIPNGRTDEGGDRDRGRWGNPPDDVCHVWGHHLSLGYMGIIENHPRINSGNKTTLEHLGTLGTGNHFIEICADTSDQIWIMLHSGSRGVGARIGNYFMTAAKEVCKKWFIELPDPFLSYFPKGTDLFDDYMEAVDWAQVFAHWNRKLMFESCVRTLENLLGSKIDIEFNIDCHHNFVCYENHFGQNVLVTRKGAVRARKGDFVIIPGSMGTRSYICEGLGNPDSFNSCSHGAGRAMSRTDAKKKFTVEDHKKATEGVVCLKDESVLEETVGAYKDIDAVIEAETDLVRVCHTLKQLVCVKGPEDPNKKRHR